MLVGFRRAGIRGMSKKGPQGRGGEICCLRGALKLIKCKWGTITEIKLHCGRIVTDVENSDLICFALIG